MVVGIFGRALVSVTAGFVLEKADDLQIGRFAIRTDQFDGNFQAVRGIEGLFSGGAAGLCCKARQHSCKPEQYQSNGDGFCYCKFHSYDLLFLEFANAARSLPSSGNRPYESTLG